MLTNEIYFLGMNIITSLTIVFLLFLLQIILFELAYAFNYKINEEGYFRFLLKKNSNLIRNFIQNYYSPTIFLFFTVYFLLDASGLIYSNYNLENSKLFLNYLHTFPFNYNYGEYFYFLNFQLLCLLFIFTMKLIKITKEHWVKKDNKFLQKNVSVKENKKLSRKENEFHLSKFLNFNSKIRKNSSAYMLFSKEKRAEIIQQKPELKFKVVEIAKLIDNYWKEMTNEEKSKYVKMSEENKKIYESGTQK